MKTHTVLIQVTDQQHAYLTAVARGRRGVERERVVVGRVPKASPARVVVNLIDAAMGRGTPSLPTSAEVVAALAAPPEYLEPDILHIGPRMIDAVPVEDLAHAAERLHELLSCLYGRVRRERMSFLPAAVETPRRIAARR